MFTFLTMIRCCPSPLSISTGLLVTAPPSSLERGGVPIQPMWPEVEQMWHHLTKREHEALAMRQQQPAGRRQQQQEGHGGGRPSSRAARGSDTWQAPIERGRRASKAPPPALSPLHSARHAGGTGVVDRAIYSREGLASRDAHDRRVHDDDHHGMAAHGPRAKGGSQKSPHNQPRHGIHGR